MAEIGVKMAFKQGVPPFPARLPLHHTKAMQDVLDRQNIVLDIEKVVPWNSVLPERAVPRVKERKLKLGEIACTEYAYGKEAANKKTVLAAGYENLSYELAKKEIYRGCSVHAGGEKYVLRGIGNSRQLAEMLVAAGETLDDHATLPVGFVENESGEQLLICQTGRMRSLDLMVGRSSRGRHEAARIIIGKLARLHSAGLGLEGGATPGKYGINPAGDVKIFNPANV
ncbi:MAG: hypothetical protein NTY61_03865, partial [Candidatus Parcubacteria bacterium]|nr:hypothetical protein [Candidatus Parcubacteria bacterium]